jgi:hypothetical protein
MQILPLSRTARPKRLTDFLFADDTQTPVPVLVVGAGLALAIAVIHLQDQGGLLGNQSPTWIKWGYYMVEISSTITAALIVRGKVIGWVLGLASSIGPMTGYILSRSVGVPGDPGDIGNWGYLLGTVSLIVEGSFIVLATTCLIQIRSLRKPSVRLQPALHAPRTTSSSTLISPGPLGSTIRRRSTASSSARPAKLRAK